MMGRLTDAINVNNALGRQNLSDKGVVVAENATTREIMNAIAEVSGGGGTEYLSIVYNEDNTITLTDKDGIDHTMACTYDDTGKLVGVTYDGKSVELTYEGENLVSVGETAVKLESATFETYSAILYSHFGVDKDVYKYLFINQIFNGSFYTAEIRIYFSQNYNVVSGTLQPLNSLKASVSTNYDFPANINEVVAELINNATADKLTSSASEWTSYTSGNTTGYLYTNRSIESTKYSSITSLDGYGENAGQQPFQNGFALGMASGGVVEVGVSKPEQEKTIDITENGTTEVVPDDGKVLSKVTVNVDVAGGSVSIDENGIVTFGNASVDENGIVTL